MKIEDELLMGCVMDKSRSPNHSVSSHNPKQYRKSKVGRNSSHLSRPHIPDMFLMIDSHRWVCHYSLTHTGKVDGCCLVGEEGELLVG